MSGGISPGSMSPNATTIEQEGVYIDNFKLVDRGRFCENELLALFDAGQLSGTRSYSRTLTISRPQIAANEKGVQELKKIFAQFGLEHGARLHGSRAGQRGGKRTPVIDRLRDCEFSCEMDQAR